MLNELKTLKILLIEDSAADTDLILRELSKAGMRFSYKRVCTNEEYLHELFSNTPSIILADYTVPGFGPISALDLRQKEHPDIPFIFVSGTIGEERAIEAIKKGATDYVLKDNLKKLPHCIERALEEAAEKGALKKAENELKK